MSKAKGIIVREQYRNLIGSVFNTDGDLLNHYVSCISICIFPEFRKVVCRYKDASFLNGTGIEATGKSKCHPDDFWNEYIGVLMALTRMRVNLTAKMNRVLCGETKKQWVPNVGDIYYECYFEDGKVCVDGIHWKNSDYDYVQLSDGNVFKTIREARKHGRRSVLNGRRIAKEARRGFTRKN